jgi:hypothetical protein
LAGSQWLKFQRLRWTYLAKDKHCLLLNMSSEVFEI